MKARYWKMMLDENIIRNVLKYTDSGKDYKTFCLVSRTWYRIIHELFGRGAKFTNHLLTLIHMKPLKFIGYGSYIVGNPCVKWEHIMEMFPDINDLDEEITDSIHSNPNITWDIIKATPVDWNIGAVSENKTVTYDVIKTDPNYGWEPMFLVRNPNITLDHILELFPGIRLHEDDLDNFSENKNITWDYVQAHPGVDWNYIDLSNNKNITWDIIKNTPDLWYWSSITERIPWEIIKSNPMYPWKYEFLHYNNSTTWKEFEEIIAEGIVLDFTELTAHPSRFLILCIKTHMGNYTKYTVSMGSYSVLS